MKYMKKEIKINAKLWLETDNKFVLGKGGAELLLKIKKTGSLTKAARSMKMSYSHAWSQVRKISLAMGKPVVETKRGGKPGGSTRLTKLGEELLARFEEEMEAMERHKAGRNK